MIGLGRFGIPNSCYLVTKQLSNANHKSATKYKLTQENLVAHISFPGPTSRHFPQLEHNTQKF